MNKAIAIDFDGCLCENAYPEIGEPNTVIIARALNEQQVYGAKLILWTCRVGERLTEAVAACDKWGLHFDAINENLPERIEKWGEDPRKVSADEYWDDRAVQILRGGEFLREDLKQ